PYIFSFILDSDKVFLIISAGGISGLPRLKSIISAPVSAFFAEAFFKPPNIDGEKLSIIYDLFIFNYFALSVLLYYKCIFNILSIFNYSTYYFFFIILYLSIFFIYLY